jgi:ribulose-phosphate 3-epimerase
MIISPSLLSANFNNLESDLNELNSINNLWLHLDIMDNHFVPNLTFGKTVIQNLNKITNLKLDAHLMVTEPEKYLETYSKINLHNFTFHYEATNNPLTLLKTAKKLYNSVGISIKPNTDVLVLDKSILELIDLVLIMSVEPGFGGQAFMPNSVDKIEYLNNQKIKNNFKFQIQVDGGISNKNANLLKNAGANNLVAGSYIFNHPQGKSFAIQSLR